MRSPGTGMVRLYTILCALGKWVIYYACFRAKLTWSIWQALLKTFAWAFTCRGFHRFAEWITAMALNIEEHTIQ